MPPLLLAFEIVEVVEKAASARAPLDVETAADAIMANHPEVEASRDEVMEVLREEGVAAGVVPTKAVAL